MNFTRKDRLVGNGATTDVPIQNTYSSVIPRKSVYIAFRIADLNELYILAADVTNAYFNVPCRENIFLW